MSYEVLARKWRPQSFADLVGQTHVVKALSYALSHQQIHHAYLFTGTRGVGKTSIARIFAKSLNCETNGVSPNPCTNCPTCLEITAGKYVDLIEVDAASRTGVEETRELIDSIAYLPSKGRYKVYLIDEVHMFSKSSFNALLKTLEEPPEHVKFILATTDPEKLPITILSRCLQFNLKSLTPVQITKHLANICQSSNIPYDYAALSLLAAAGDGSMRDTLSMTDQAIAYGRGELRLNTVTEILGTIQPNDIEAILFAITTNNPHQLHQALKRLDDYEVDARAFLIDVMQRLQRMAWAKEGIVDNLSPALLSTITDIPKPLLHVWYDIAEKALPNLSIAGEPRKAVEMALLRMLAFIPEDWVVRHRTLLETDQQIEPEQPTTINDVDEIHATPIQASPVITHDSLDDAEDQFSNTVPVIEPAVEPIANPATQTAQQQTAESSQITPQPPQTAAQEPKSEVTIEENIENWHLSAGSDDSEPVPSMDDIHAMMHSGRDVPQPKVAPAANIVPDEAPQEQLSEPPPWEEPHNTPDNSANSITENREAQHSVEEHVTNDGEIPRASEPHEFTLSPIPDSSDEPAHTASSIEQFDWHQTLPTLGLSGYTNHLASLGILHINQSEGYIEAILDLAPKHELLITDESIQELSKALENEFRASIKVTTNLTSVDAITPNERDKMQSDKKQSDLVETFYQEPLTQQVLQQFDGEVIEKTIKTKIDTPE